jgi:hypothetical protein
MLSSANQSVQSKMKDWAEVINLTGGTVRATVFCMKPESFCYTACPLDDGGKQCNKKVTYNVMAWGCVIEVSTLYLSVMTG